MNPTTIGLDIAKNVFQAHGVDNGKVVVRKRSHGQRCWSSLPIFRRASSAWRLAPGPTTGRGS